LAAIMWDAGLDPGLVGRRVGECEALALQDVTIRSAMMERRWLAGDPSLMARMGLAIDALPALDFYLAKSREQRERHGRHGDSPFGLEPNVKESPGGLRDLQVPMWVARAMGIEPSWSGLKEAGLLTGGEAELAAACEARLALVRAMLHVQTGRREERLAFDAQSKMAERLGIGMEDGKSAAAVMMDGYFSCARSVVMINEVLLQSMAERLMGSESGPVRRLSDRFYEQGGLLWADSDEVFARAPSAIFEAFEWMQTDDALLGMGSRCTRALWRASRRVDSWFRSDQANRAAFVRMLSRPQGVVTEIARMARVGLLGAYLPSFGKAETLMQHDLFHAWTVGRHTLGVIRNLRRFGRADRAHELPRISALASGFERYWLLYVGALFHDIAKGRGGRHEEKGELDARDFCSQHGIDGEDQDLVAFLVRWHLEMSSVSQKKDLEDHEVVESFAALCQTPRRLDALYLLTVADMRATGPTVWNAWKAQLLDELWSKARHVLAGSAINPQSKVEMGRALALAAALESGAEEAQAREYVDALGDGYYLRTDPGECAWHASALAGADRGVSTCVVEMRASGRVDVLVWSRDQRGLFAKICSGLAKAGLSVDAAKLSTSSAGWAIDAFLAHDTREDPDPQKRASSIQKMVLAAIDPNASEQSAPAMGRVSARAKSAGSIAQAKVDPAGSDWLVEVACADRSGVLWSIAEEFEKRGLSVKSARVTTVGERAEDVFVVAGDGLDAPEGRLELESALVARLGL
jgi:[protein-PII] uridylyltransferase